MKIVTTLLAILVMAAIAHAQSKPKPQQQPISPQTAPPGGFKPSTKLQGGRNVFSPSDEPKPAMIGNINKKMDEKK